MSVSANVVVDTNGKMSDDEMISCGAGASLAPIPYYEVMAGYAKELKKYKLKDLFKWKYGSKNKVKIAGVKVEFKKCKTSLRVKSKKAGGCFYLYPQKGNKKSKKVKMQRS